MDTRELNDIMSQLTTNHHYLLAQVTIWLTSLWRFYSMVLSARLVPRMLIDVQKADRAETSASLLALFNRNPDDFISRFVTVDKTWLHHFDHGSKAQSMAWEHVISLPPRQFHVFISACKVMATVFWDSEGIVLIDYLEHDRSITGTYYADLIKKCRAALKEKRRGKLWCGLLFHQDNAPAHSSSQALTAIRNAGFELLRHPSYSPDLAPSDFICFQNWMNSWKDGNLLMMVMLPAPLMTGWRTKIKNSSTIEYGPWRITGLSAFLLKRTMLKSDKISCSYSVANCIRLRTFWMLLVCNCNALHCTDTGICVVSNMY